MPIKTNMQSLKPRREQYKREINLLSKDHTLPPELKDKWPNGKITIYPWDHTVDNYFLEENRRGTQKEMLLFKLVEKLVDLNGVSIEHFPAEEVNTVLMVARSIGSERVSYECRCPMCGTTEKNEISIPSELEKKGEKDADWPGYDDITLPDCKDVVRLRILTVKDEQIIAKRPADRKREISDSDLRTLMPIISINEGSPDTMEELEAWYSALSPVDVKSLMEQQRDVAPHLNTSLPMQCDSCRHSYVHVLLFDRLFFR